MLVTLDFETYYGYGYGLKIQTTEEYIRHREFEVIGFALKIDDQPAQWYSGDMLYLLTVLQSIDWSKAVLLAHNCRFDAAILAWKFGIRPAKYMDTQSMAM